MAAAHSQHGLPTGRGHKGEAGRRLSLRMRPAFEIQASGKVACSWTTDLEGLARITRNVRRR